MAKAFPQWPVTAVPVHSPVLHLKSMSSMAGIDVIAISETASGNTAWKEIESQAHFKYKRLGFPGMFLSALYACECILCSIVGYNRNT